MARVSYLRPAVTSPRTAPAGSTSAVRDARCPGAVGGSTPARRWGPRGSSSSWSAFSSPHPTASLTSDSQALARVGMPLGGGTIESVSAATGSQSPAHPRGGPRRSDLAAPADSRPPARHRRMSPIRRPGSTGWLAGHTEQMRLTLMTPSATLRDHYLTLGGGQPLTLHSSSRSKRFPTAPPGSWSAVCSRGRSSEIRLHRPAPAGTISVAAVPRRWETSPPTVISWFPAGAAATAVASPAPGSLDPAPLRDHPDLLQAGVPGAALAAAGLPGHGRQLASGQQPRDHVQAPGLRLRARRKCQHRPARRGQDRRWPGRVAASASWKVPGGSPMRLQQLLAGLGYLPLRFAGHTHVGPDARRAGGRRHQSAARARSCGSTRTCREHCARSGSPGPPGC